MDESRQKQADAIRVAVIERTAARLRRFLARPALVRFFSGEGPRGMWVAEYPAVDPVTFMCAGSPMRAWRVEPEEIFTIEPERVNPGEVRGRMWERPITGFHIPEDPATVYVNEMEGPQYGTLIRFDVSFDGAIPTLKSRKAVLLMHGTIVG